MYFIAEEKARFAIFRDNMRLAAKIQQTEKGTARYGATKFADVSSESLRCFNSSPPGQNGRHFADDIFRCIFVNEKFCISNKISLKFVPKGPFDSNLALV